MSIWAGLAWTLYWLLYFHWHSHFQQFFFASSWSNLQLLGISTRERLYRDSGQPLVQIKGSVITLEKYSWGEFFSLDKNDATFLKECKARHFMTLHYPSYFKGSRAVFTDVVCHSPYTTALWFQQHSQLRKSVVAAERQISHCMGEINHCMGVINNDSGLTHSILMSPMQYWLERMM